MKIYGIIFAILLIGVSCVYYPNLSLDVQDVYTKSTVVIQYSFRSEAPFQSCLIILLKEGEVSEKLFTRDPDDRKMPQDGELVFTDMENGDYLLRFSVLSDRGREPHILAFLDKTYSFSVMIP